MLFKMRAKISSSKALALLFVTLAVSQLQTSTSSSSSPPRTTINPTTLTITNTTSCPLSVNVTFLPPYSVINQTSPGSQDNKHGYEDGRVVRTPSDNVFHLAVAEMIDDPFWVKMRLGHWSSVDGWNWTRVGTFIESSGKTDFSDSCAAVWGSSFQFDPTKNTWALIYVCYNSGPSNSSGWYGNFNGSIFVSYSTVQGDTGIGGPYNTSDPVLTQNVLYPLPGGYRQWQGLQGTDSFFPYLLPNGTWAGIYGTAHTETPNVFPLEWVAGFASSPTLMGPWTRYPVADPQILNIATTTENPMVFPAPPASVGTTGTNYMLVYDDIQHEGTGFGFACSADGVNWPQGELIPTSGGARTPFALLPMTPSDVERNAGLIISSSDYNNTAPYWLFYSQQVSGYEVVRTALVSVSW